MDPQEQLPVNGSGHNSPEPVVLPPDELQEELRQMYAPRPRYMRHFIFLLLTMFTTMVVGARMQDCFNHHQLLFFGDKDFFPLKWILEDPRRLLMGLPYSLSLLGILFAHEMGHYLMCVRYGVYATLPFFIPVPLQTGTFGAVIVIRSPFRSRADLFDIAIGGPIAGFLVAVPVAAWGLAHSLRITPELDPVSIELGTPLIFRCVYTVMQWLNIVSPGAANAHELYFHPVAIAAWMGMLATMLNLLPGGQLDGGHIIHALDSRAHKWITRATIVALIPLCWFYWMGWLIWAFFIYLARKHPPVEEHPGLGTGRKILAVVALVMFILTFMPDPLMAGSLRDVGSQIFEELVGIVDWIARML